MLILMLTPILQVAQVQETKVALVQVSNLQLKVETKSLMMMILV
jgi:hypothetical protein